MADYLVMELGDGQPGMSRAWEEGVGKPLIKGSALDVELALTEMVGELGAGWTGENGA